MLKTLARLAFLALAGFTAAASAQITTVIDDDLNADTSANYSVVSLNNDGSATFAYDYSADGIAPAPRTTDGTTLGLRLTANDTLGADDATSVFHNTMVQANARVTVDMYLGQTGFSGTTEFGSVGLGSSGATPFTIFSPIGGDGTHMTASTDTDTSSNWRYSRPSGDDPSASVPVNSSVADYLLGGTGFANYTGVVPPDGVAGNQWVTLTLQTVGGATDVWLNGTQIIHGNSVGNADGTNLGGLAPGGLASMTHADVFTSLANPPQSQFAVFDNFLVEEVPEPTCLGLLSLAGLGLFLGGRRAR